MLAFYDREGRFWSGDLTIGSALAVRKHAGVDVMEFASGGDPPEWLEDAGTLAAAACVLFRGQYEARGMTEGAFGDLLRKHVPPADLSRMFGEELEEFFRVPKPPRKRPSDQSAAEVSEDESWDDVERLAATAGIDDPAPLTFGRLVARARHAQRERWTHTAALRTDIRLYGMNGPRRVQTKDVTPKGMFDDDEGGRGGLPAGRRRYTNLPDGTCRVEFGEEELN